MDVVVRQPASPSVSVPPLKVNPLVVVGVKLKVSDVTPGPGVPGAPPLSVMECVDWRVRRTERSALHYRPAAEHVVERGGARGERPVAAVAGAPTAGKRAVHRAVVGVTTVGR